VVVGRESVDTVVAVACAVGFADEEQAASAVPAASAPSPFKTDRRLSAAASSLLIESGCSSSTAPLRASRIRSVYYLIAANPGPDLL